VNTEEIRFLRNFEPQNQINPDRTQLYFGVQERRLCEFEHKPIYAYIGHNIKARVATMEELITIQQVANYLKVDRFTVYRLVTQKRIPAFKVGGQWRFKQEMIDSWLMRNSNMKNGDQDYIELHALDPTS